MSLPVNIALFTWSAAHLKAKMVELKPFKGHYYLWKYLPSIPLAGAFAAAFLILTILLCWRMFKTRYWSAIPFAIGGVCMCSMKD
jgi:hypothetical protein